MSEKQKIIGAFEWADLTIENAEEVKDFYQQVIGFTTTDVNMGDYNDFCMNSPTDGQTKVGICHAKGTNKNIPPQWMIYFNVEDLDQSMQSVKEQGGEIIDGPKGNSESGRYCFIKDPSGAHCALYEKKTK